MLSEISSKFFMNISEINTKNGAAVTCVRESCLKWFWRISRSLELVKLILFQIIMGMSYRKAVTSFNVPNTGIENRK